MAVAQDYVAVAQQLYVSYFGRPADYFGLQNFTAQLAALDAPTTIEGVSAAVNADKASPLAALVNSFSTAPESVALYGTDTSQVGLSKFVEAIYLNVLGRAPDVGGWDYWIGEISSGRVTRATAAVSITHGALLNTSPQGLLDAVTVKNKLAVATSFTAGLDEVSEINAYSGDAAAATARGLLGNVNNSTDVAAYQATVVDTIAQVVSGSIPGVSTVLTDAVGEVVVGGNGNDTFSGIVGTGATLNNLDSIDGGAGTDTLNLLSDGALSLPASVSIKNVETLAIRGTGAVTFDQTAATGITGLTKIAVTQATTATITAAATTAVAVSGATGAIIIDGGSSNTVATTAANDVTIGATTVAKGAIIVTAAAQGAGNYAIDGGTSVSVTAAGAGAGTIDIGQGGLASDLASGVIAVTSTGAAAAGAAPVTLGAITIDGGSKVSVVQTATSNAAAAVDDIAAVTNVITQSAVTITGGATTTEVTVQQTAASAGVNAVAAAAGATTLDVVTFVGMLATETVTVGGLTFTAAKTLTAAQVAAAFAGLTAGATHGNAVAGNGIYSGTFSGNFNSAAVSGSTVTFTAKAAGAVATIGVGDTVVAGNVAVSETTAGLAVTKGVAGELAVAGGAVVVADSGSKTLATVTLSGYGASSTVTSSGLTTLNLAHSDADVAVTNATAATLALNVDAVGVDAAGAVTLDTTYKTVNLGVASDSTFALTSGVTALNVSGAGVADLSGSTVAALKTVKVTGTAGLTVDASVATVTSVDTTGTTGTSTIIINAANATYAGGAGVDNVTLSAAAVKAVSLGDGDDSLTLASGTTSATANLDGGAGTDTLAMAAADAATASGNSTFASKISGFEKLALGIAATDVVDLANLDNINYIISAGNTTSLELQNLAANSTVELTAAGTLVTAGLADDTGTADVLNVVTKVGLADINFGKIDAAGVETVNLTVTDTTTAVDVNIATLEVTGDALKSIVLTGNSHVVLTDAVANTVLTSIDGSALTGSLTASTGAVAAVTIKGGAGADMLTSAGANSVLQGGAGNDTLVVGAGSSQATLTGGAGADTFDVSAPTVNVNSYATISDLTAGDIIKFTATAVEFNASKVSLAPTAVFQDYANAAIAATDTGDVSWFQYQGNTYVIDNVSNGATFSNSVDAIVKITGTVDLSAASFSSSGHTLVLIG